MTLETFTRSESLTLGVELELQIVATHDYDLTPSAADLLRLVGRRSLPGSVVPEISDSMIEMSTGICSDHADALAQLGEIRDALVDCADKLNVALCGGGTHPFQDWSRRRIFDKPRFQQLSELYGYLSKQFTIFGQHVHIGCPSADQALWLLHGMSRFIPHLIALSASSPFVQGTDTRFHSARQVVPSVPPARKGRKAWRVYPAQEARPPPEVHQAPYALQARPVRQAHEADRVLCACQAETALQIHHVPQA